MKRYISLFLNDSGQVTPHEIPLMSYLDARDLAADYSDIYAGTIELNEMTGECRLFQITEDDDA